MAKLHAMGEFGTVPGTAVGSAEAVRIDPLELRHAPLVPFPHRHAFFHLVVVLRVPRSRGRRGWHEIDLVRHPVEAGTAFFMRPGQVHAWELVPGTAGYVVEFERDHSNTDLGEVAAAIPDFQRLGAAGRGRRLTTLLAWMRTEYVERGPRYLSSLRHALACLLIELARTDPRALISARASTAVPGTARAAAAPDAFTERFTYLVEEHFAREHAVGFYAGRMRLTPKALTMRMSRSLGVSARDVIQARVLLEAKRLLVYSDLPVADIAERLGFADPSYFTRFFREHAGRPPAEFRQRERA